MSQNDDYIVEILRDLGMVTLAQVENARSNMGPDGLISTLVQNGVISELDVARTLAAQNLSLIHI